MLIRRDHNAKPESLPSALDKVMTTAELEVRLLVAPLEEVWYEIGVRIAQYRDCTAAHHPITALGGDSRASLNDADLWEMRIEIPDNPDATKADAFTFDQEIDLLDYCWRSTCAVVRCIEATLPPVYELAMSGQERSKWTWLTGE